MSILDLAKADILQITSDTDNGFAISIKITSPTNETATITGLHTKIGLNIDSEGNAIDAKKVHASFAEKALTDAGFTVRKGDSEVNLVGCVLEIADNTGIAKKYTILRCFPDETIGLLTCVLEDFE